MALTYSGCGVTSAVGCDRSSKLGGPGACFARAVDPPPRVAVAVRPRPPFAAADSVDLDEVVWLPGLIVKGVLSAVEAQWHHEVPARNRLDESRICHALGFLGPEPDVEGTVLVLRDVIVAVGRRQKLLGLWHGAV